MTDGGTVPVDRPVDRPVVGAADPAALLPALRQGEESQLALPVELVAALRLPPSTLAGAPAWAALVRDRAGRQLGVPLVADGSAVGGLRRARPGDGAAEALLQLLQGPADPPFEVVGMHDIDASAERGLGAGVDQTHESVVVGDSAVVKWSVHVDAVPSVPPAVAAARHLDAVGFRETPEPVGFLVHHDEDRQVLLASVTRFLPGALDGWDWYVDDLLAWARGAVPDATVVEPATALGGLVARMHVAFATPWSGSPDPVARAGTVEVESWRRRALGTVDEASRVTVGPAGDRFRQRADLARQVVTAGLDAAVGTQLTRVHGDLHVGQVLRWDGGYAVSDFDGNPVLPAAERDLPQPPARDGAGMLRALDHVGRIVDRRTGGESAERVRGWSARAREAFLAAYDTATRAAGHGDLLDARLLPAFEVEQECRELVYAARHLPRWTYVPDTALTELLPVPAEGEV